MDSLKELLKLISTSGVNTRFLRNNIVLWHIIAIIKVEALPWCMTEYILDIFSFLFSYPLMPPYSFYTSNGPFQNVSVYFSCKSNQTAFSDLQMEFET